MRNVHMASHLGITSPSSMNHERERERELHQQEDELAGRMMGIHSCDAIKKENTSQGPSLSYNEIFMEYISVNMSSLTI